jgi:hypothetical protein
VSKVPAYFVVSALHRDRRLALLFGIVAIMAGGGVMFYAVLPWWGEAIGMFVSGLAGSWAYGIVFQVRVDPLTPQRIHVASHTQMP